MSMDGDVGKGRTIRALLSVYAAVKFCSCASALPFTVNPCLHSSARVSVALCMNVCAYAHDLRS